MFEGLRFKNWRFEQDVDGIVTLTLDRAGSSVNSLGRAVIDELQEIVERLSELDAWSEAQIRAGIQQAITDYRTLGCTCSFGDWQKNVNAIAAGFRAGPGQPIMVRRMPRPGSPITRTRPCPASAA